MSIYIMVLVNRNVKNISDWEILYFFYCRSPDASPSPRQELYPGTPVGLQDPLWGSGLSLYRQPHGTLVLPKNPLKSAAHYFGECI